MNMNTQGIRGTTSWVQFQQLTQAARVRNGGFGAQIAAQGNAVQSEKRAADVYSKAQGGLQRAAAVSSPAEPVKRTLGSQFDAYA